MVTVLILGGMVAGLAALNYWTFGDISAACQLAEYYGYELGNCLLP